MIDEQTDRLSKLETEAERAAYLLSIGVTAKITIEDLTPVYRAVVGSMQLSITSDSEEEAIRKGTEWLKQKADPTTYRRC
ncbi:hypothetical protein GZ77_20670 [Endozoicomonas montiporae]|uniref:Uncharacterized protein n=2 Tax=Endozoicomonas montiporae TaxID=1027273 RepID=A0A081N335_9GAMM|nr:hypothetical protein [Endozoicomonas montiporae]AMO58151.1 hypothetical protein EZMO1_4228 [Endozoicomonas montiporae CL-33]KEQ12858.1 hypothetical protein GZ77_20670 [Endozoicomonas montiporae]